MSLAPTAGTRPGPTFGSSRGRAESARPGRREVRPGRRAGAATRRPAFGRERRVRGRPGPRVGCGRCPARDRRRTPSCRRLVSCCATAPRRTAPSAGAGARRRRSSPSRRCATSPRRVRGQDAARDSDRRPAGGRGGDRGDPARRAGDGRRLPAPGARGPRRPPRDAARRGGADAGRATTSACRPAWTGAGLRPDPMLATGGSAVQAMGRLSRGGRPLGAARVPGRRARGPRRGRGRASRGGGLDRGDRPGSSTSTATSAPAWATPATACSARLPE